MSEDTASDPQLNSSTERRFLVVVHISDLHVRCTDDLCLGRAVGVVAALRPLMRYANGALLAWTGDLTQAGQEEQFAAAQKLRDSILTGLRTEFPSVPTASAVVPGNHDCDLSGDRTVREMLLDKLAAERRSDLTKDLLATCERPLTAYHSFFPPATTLPHSAAPHSSLVGTCELATLADVQVRVVGLNTAWCSRLHERPGGLYFPEEAIPNAANNSFTVVLLHHPLQWLEPNNAKRLRRRLEAVADLVLTGHEHEVDARAVCTSSGHGALYVEGGLFEEVRDTPGTFNALVVDVAAHRYQHLVYTWDSSQDGFRAPSAEAVLEDPTSWPQLPLVRHRRAAAYSLEQSFSESLNDLGINVEHPIRGRLGLEDLYTVPDLRRHVLLSERPADPIPSSRVLSRLMDHSQVLISGDSQAGKTALAKRLFLAFRAGGFVPLLLAGPKRPVFGVDLDKMLQQKFSEQYSAPTAEAYSQLPVAQRAIIVDDFHLMTCKAQLRKRFREELARFADHVIFFGHDMLLSVEDALGFEGGSTVQRYSILPLSHARRGELVERWASLDTQAEPREVAHAIQDTCRLVDSIIGKNFVPAYPPYVLALLQAKSSMTTVDANAGSHGYFYELLIRCALARETPTEEFDMLMAFLVHIAATMLIRQSRSLSEGELIDAHARFEERVDVDFDFKANIERLKKRNVLDEVAGEFRFKYRYLFYYFAAVHLRDNLAAFETRERIRTFAASLHVEESANVLLFLTHLTKDPFVIDELLTIARSSFGECPPATLNNGEYAGADFATLAESTKRYLETDPEEARRRAFSEMDDEQKRAEVDAERLAAREPAAEMVRVGQALAVIQILGQVLKNFPGTLEATRKAEIVAVVYGVGRRFLSFYLDLVAASGTDLIHEIARLISSVHPKFTVDKVIRRAQEALSGLVALTSFAMVKRVSVAVGSRHLTRTYRKVLEDVPVVRLFDFSLQLDHAGEFPIAALKGLAGLLDGIVLPMIVLRGLVAQHLQLFPVEFAAKQAACAVLDMKIDRSDLSNAATKLLLR
ncbi:MAG: metallophosphoesterase [Myxococcales bacterium]|nr:metallophosphoesterase [Myxococcales bacterium]